MEDATRVVCGLPAAIIALTFLPGALLLGPVLNTVAECIILYY